jgi:hypothetical protein
MRALYLDSSCPSGKDGKESRGLVINQGAQSRGMNYL